MNIDKRIKKLLYRSFDDRLKPKEQAMLNQALEDSLELQSEMRDIKAQRETITKAAVLTFKPFFVENVMEKVNGIAGKPNGLAFQLFYESLVSVFRRFAMAGTVISIVFFIYNLGIGDVLPFEEAITMSDLTIREILSIF